MFYATLITNTMSRKYFFGLFSKYLFRIENFQVKIFQSFSEIHFSPRFMLPCSLLAENIFSVFFSKYLFRIENVLSQNILKVFLETTLVHVSCYPDHYEPKIFFSIFEVRNYSSIWMMINHSTLDCHVTFLTCSLGGPE